VRDIFHKCSQFLANPKMIDRAKCGLAAQIFSGSSPPGNAGPWIESNGQRMLQFSSNNYLGLAMHPEVRARAVEIVNQYGIGSPMGSRLLTGTTEHHLELERQVAAFKRCQSALTFASGAMAMMGTLACLARPGDLLILDEHAHATLVCGAKISGAEILFFRHNDVGHLEQILNRRAGSKAVAIVVDGVYSMDGDMAPLAELVALKQCYDARLIVDDAHGTGVCGQSGRGTAALFGVEDDVDLHLGTFSKAVGTIGGFVAGSRAVIEYIRYNAPTFAFTKAMPLAVVAATQQALQLLEEADAQRETLWENKRRLQDGLKDRGFQVGGTQSPITPIQIEGTEAIYFAHELRRVYGIWVAPVLYPAVPLGKSILRMIPTALHCEADIDYLLRGVSAIRGSMILGSMPVS
jgi:8-amino-7-oxononanoate synthase